MVVLKTNWSLTVKTFSVQTVVMIEVVAGGVCGEGGLP